MKKLNFDIGLAPLANTTFNYHKSGIKIIEYSYFGIPWIASKSPAYLEVCDHWGWKGRLCKTSEDWMQNFEQLVQKNIRIKEGNSLNNLAKKWSDFKIGVTDWQTIIKGVIH